MKKRKINITLDKELVEYADNLAKNHGLSSRSGAINYLLSLAKLNKKG